MAGLFIDGKWFAVIGAAEISGRCKRAVETQTPGEEQIEKKQKQCAGADEKPKL